MKYEELVAEKLIIVGIAIRTNNAGKAEKDIPQLWADFFAKNILASIDNRLSDDIYCVYTDYESDCTGDYTTLLGCAVSQVENISADLVVKEIPASKYNKFISEGKIPECVGNTWYHIWNTDYDRSYIADFDVYGKEASDANNAKVITYLSIK